MALINCPSCGKEVSDKASACPQCGFRLLKSETDSAPEVRKNICKDCGNELSEGVDICPNCGRPVHISDEEVKEIKSPQQAEPTKTNIHLFKKKSFWISIFGCIILISGIILGASIYHNKQEEKRQEEYAKQQEEKRQEEYVKAYNGNMKKALSLMLSGTAKAEKAGNLIVGVWHDAIYEENYNAETAKYLTGTSDFNEALNNLFSDEDFQKQIDDIKENQNSVDNVMKKLNNPPDEYRDAYDSLCEYYETYVEFTNLVINPTGSYNSYKSDFNNADSETIIIYKKTQILLGE